MIDLHEPVLAQVAAMPMPATPYLALDVDIVRRQLARIRAALPTAAIHYAVKCNPHVRIISALAAAGCDFEIASVAELDLLLDLGAARDTLLFSNPVKAPAQIAYAYARGVRRFAVDCADEITKLAALAPGASVLIRLDVSNTASVVPLAGKFGATPHDAVNLLSQAARAGLVPYGLTFHVGSQALEADAWSKAIGVCRGVMHALLERGERIQMIDLGGGYPVPYEEPVLAVAAIGKAVTAAIETLPYPVSLAAEPGRYLTAEAGVMSATVIGRASRRGEEWLHLDVGAFGGLMEALETRRTLRYPIRCTHPHGLPPREVSLAVTGPTCDSEDTILLNARVCAQLRTGDVVEIGMTGAYTTAYASTFNGFPLPTVVTRDLVARVAAPRTLTLA